MFMGFTLLLCICGTQASILFKPPRTRNGYEKNAADNSLDYQDIKDNLILDEYDVTQDLFPPKPYAKDYYDYSQYKGPPVQNPAVNKDTEYVIDTANKVLRLNTEEGSEEKKLRPIEQAEIKKLSAAFAKLFEDSKLENFDWGSQTQTQPPAVTEQDASSSTTPAWENLNPIITVSKSGVSISFGNESKPEEGNGTTTSEDDPDRDTLWDSLAKSVDKVLEDELDRRLNTTDDGNSTEEDLVTEAYEEEPSTLNRFVKSIWNVMRSSLDYISAFFSTLMGGEEAVDADASNSTDDSTSAETEVNSPLPPTTTTTAVFALEEPTSFHRLPSEESDKRGRDVDSLYYGYGIA